MRRFLPRPTSSKAYLHHIPMTGPAHAVPEPPSTARIRAIIVARMARTSVYQTSRSDCRLLVSYIAVNSSESFSGLAPGNGPVAQKALRSIAYSLIGNGPQPRGCVVGFPDRWTSGGWIAPESRSSVVAAASFKRGSKEKSLSCLHQS